VHKRVLGADLLLLLTAAVWGFGFVAQRSGMFYVGPFTFNAIRFPLGSLSLFPLIAWRRCFKPGEKSGGLFFSSFLAGTCLFIAVSFQQLGIMFTTAGNAGFITGLYVIFTPLFGIFLGRSTGKATWIGAILTFTGLYFLSSRDPLKDINIGDLIIAVSAVFWAFHVLVIDRLVQKTDPIALSSGQFAFAGLYALIAAFFAEPFLSSRLLSLSSSSIATSGLVTWKSFPALISGLSSGEIPFALVSGAVIPILYGGFASAGIGYTLQAAAQQYAPPAHATIILCLEGFFAAIGGIMLLHEPAGIRTIIGFAFMLCGMLVSQWELIRSRS
jgi:drug/metabolite transporter (DMT)-like permease